MRERLKKDCRNKKKGTGKENNTIKLRFNKATERKKSKWVKLLLMHEK